MIQFLSADLMGITIYDIIIKITLGYLVRGCKNFCVYRK